MQTQLKRKGSPNANRQQLNVNNKPAKQTQSQANAKHCQTRQTNTKQHNEKHMQTQRT